MMVRLNNWGRLLVILAFAGLTAMVLGQSAAGEFRKAPSSRVAFDLPPAFVPSKQFTGFVDEAGGVSIIVVDMPATAFAEIAPTPATLLDTFAQRGMIDLAAKQLARSDQYIYLRGRQASQVGYLVKYMLLVRNDEHAAFITVALVEDALTSGMVTEATVERILANARIEKDLGADLQGNRLSYLGPFKDSGVIGGSNRIYSLTGGTPGPHNRGKPVFIVANSLDQLPAGDLNGIVTTALQGLNVTDVVAGERRRVVIAGLEGLEALAEASEREGGRRVLVYQAVFPGKSGGYTRLIGIVSAAEAAEYLPEFRKMTESFNPQ